MSTTQITHAIILAAGLGKRMRPLTDNMPKPLVSVADKPLIDYGIDNLMQAGIHTIVVNSSYLAEMLESHLQATYKEHIQISREITPLETGGGIYQALPLLGDAHFIVMNGDIICISHAEHFIHRLAQHWEDDLDALMLLHPVNRAIGYNGPGDFFCEDGELTRRLQHDTAPYVFAGVQIMHPRLFAQVPDTQEFSLNALYNQRMEPSGKLTRIKGVIHEGDWLHVGDLKGLEEANQYFSARTTQSRLQA